MQLRQLVGPGKRTLHYRYDFGDSWDHRLTVMGDQPAGGDVPRCVLGVRCRPRPGLRRGLGSDGEGPGGAGSAPPRARRRPGVAGPGRRRDAGPHGVRRRRGRPAVGRAARARYPAHGRGGLPTHRGRAWDTTSRAGAAAEGTPPAPRRPVGRWLDRHGNGAAGASGSSDMVMACLAYPWHDGECVATAFGS